MGASEAGGEQWPMPVAQRDNLRAEVGGAKKKASIMIKIECPMTTILKL